MSAAQNDFEILVVTHKHPPSVGGMQKQSFELVKNLQSFTIVRKIIFRGKYPKALFFVIAVPWVLLKLYKYPNIKVIHANDGLMALFLTPLLFLTHRKLAATVHGLDVVFDSAAYQYWLRHYLSQFSCIIAVSEQTRQACIKAGIPERKVYYIPNGFEPANANSPALLTFEGLSREYKIDFAKKAIICSIGRPVKRKGFVWFIENVLPQLTHDCLYLIAGPREEHMRMIRVLSAVFPATVFTKISHLFGFALEALHLDRLAVDERFRGKVRYLGKIPQSQLDQLLAHTHLLVMPNIRVAGDYEGFGLVALEAASRGVVCLAADTDGIPSAVKDGVNGFLLPSGDAKTWITKINELLGDKKELLRLGASFKVNEEMIMFTWNKMAESYYRLLLTTSRNHHK